jgi:hypothetical protein
MQLGQAHTASKEQLSENADLSGTPNMRTSQNFVKAEFGVVPIR